MPSGLGYGRAHPSGGEPSKGGMYDFGGVTLNPILGAGGLSGDRLYLLELLRLIDARLN